MPIESRRTAAERRAIERDALGLFTDRTGPIRRFLGYLNDDPGPSTVLFFHGVGGSGKSLLLRHLRESFLKRLPSRRWLEVRKHPDEVVVDKVLSAPAGRERPIGGQEAQSRDFVITSALSDIPRLAPSARCRKVRHKAAILS